MPLARSRAVKAGTPVFSVRQPISMVAARARVSCAAAAFVSAPSRAKAPCKRMILAPLCTIPLFMVSKELLAELTSRPSTSAVSVATVPALSFTTSCVSLLRWCPGKSLCSHIPSREPKKMQPALVKAMDVEFIFSSILVGRGFLASRLRAESLKKYPKAPAPNITNLIVIVADLALSESLLDLINSTGSHETPSFHVSSPCVRLRALKRSTRRCFPENPRGQRKFPGTLRFGYSSRQACPEQRRKDAKSANWHANKIFLPPVLRITLSKSRQALLLDFGPIGHSADTRQEHAQTDAR